MSTIILSEATLTLRGVVREKFAKARASQDIIFAETQLATIKTKLPLPIQVRYCPALAKKPVNSDTDRTVSNKKFDPFENPSANLLIAEVPYKSPTHNIVLNKYPVIENHFILATKENKPQTGLLDEDDLFLALTCLRDWKRDYAKQLEYEHDADHCLFAFFNSGEHSGASQPHRHIQFLPIEDMRDSQNHDDWSLLCDSFVTPVHPSLPLLQCRGLDCVHYAVPLEADVDKADLHRQYVLLLKAALASISSESSLEKIDEAKIVENGQTAFSYNLAMTKGLMAILPRRSEAARISGMDDIYVNGTFLAGTMMVKVEADWHELQSDASKLQQIISRIAYSRSDQQKL